MKPFRNCPRCDKWYLIRRYWCRRCEFELLDNPHNGKISFFGYLFYTKSYRIAAHYTKRYGYVSLIRDPESSTYVPFAFTPKAQDEDIDKVLILS